LPAPAWQGAEKRANTGDKIAGVPGDVKFRAERKLGGTIEKPLASLPEASRRTDTGDKIAGITG
jgi:hypothetical protein